MTVNQQSVGDAPVREFEYDDAVVFAADLGAASDPVVDVVDGTVVVATDDDQYDLDVPADEAQAFIHNGVLTIEVTDDYQEGDA